MTTAKIYVPTDVCDDVHSEIQTRMADEYGGFTAYEGQGGWKNDDGEIITENVRVYEVVAPSTADGGKLYCFMGSLAEHVKYNTDQDSVLAYVGSSSASDGETIML
jgi:hypothetical protein